MASGVILRRVCFQDTVYFVRVNLQELFVILELEIDAKAYKLKNAGRKK